MSTMRYFSPLIVMILVMLLTQGCLHRRVAKPRPQPVEKQERERDLEKKRPRISTKRNRYEGSLWRDEASFGNLLRDHRARFRHDLLTITNIGSIVTVPPAKAKEKESKKTRKMNALLESISLKESLEEEQNDILRSLETMSAEVIKVLPNGNMMIRARKIDYRQRNEVQYVTTVVGILRPADVDESNIVPAEKLVYPEVKVKRRILGNLLEKRLQSLEPLVGRTRAGFLQRLSDFAESGKKKRRKSSK